MTPETSIAGVNEVVAYLNADFAANYEKLLSGHYEMVRDPGKIDFRNSSGSSFGERFGVVVYNPVDGTKAGTGDIAGYRVLTWTTRRRSTTRCRTPATGRDGRRWGRCPNRRAGCCSSWASPASRSGVGGYDHVTQM